MKDNRMKILISIFLIVALLLISKASALGITPGRTSINFASGDEKTVSFSIENNEYKQLSVSLSAEGELSKYVSLSEKEVSLSSEEERKTLQYTIKLPESLEPGLHTAEIIVTERPSASSGQTNVQATVAVTTQIYVYVSCPGKCIESDLNLLDAQQDSETTLVIPVINRGKQKIDSVKATIEIYSGNSKVDSIETLSSSISPGARTELSAKWNSQVPGDYTARVKIVYDGEEQNFEKSFSVGKNVLTLDRILVNDFRLGQIAKLRILVENKQNQELKDVLANLIVYDKGYQVLSDVKSATENIPALSQKELVAYWDTAGIEAGQYNGKLSIKHEKGNVDKTLVLNVNPSSLDILGVGFAVNSKSGTSISITTILIIIIGILVVGNIAWFIFFRRSKAKKEKGTGKTYVSHEKSNEKGGVVKLK